MKLEFEDIIKERLPELVVALISADVVNQQTTNELWEEIADVAKNLKEQVAIDKINKIPAITATRLAYKSLGKDPNRYRPSAESLTRRAVKGLELYRSTAIVDLINLVSLQTGHSIGAFDADKIYGNTLKLGVGREVEPYEAIGRGQLNIAGLPVWRDNIGGIGTPTSDNERTKLSENTSRLIVTLNCYSQEPSAQQTALMINELLIKFAFAHNITTTFYHP